MEGGYEVELRCGPTSGSDRLRERRIPELWPLTDTRIVPTKAVIRLYYSEMVARRVSGPQ